MRNAWLLAALGASAALASALGACGGSADDTALFSDGGNGNGGDDGAHGDDGSPGGDDGTAKDARAHDAKGGDDGSQGDDGSSGDDGGISDAAIDNWDGFDGNTCVGLQCQQVACPDGGTTTISGTVLDPAKKNPIYDAVVYVRNAALAPIVHGPTCDRCTDVPSGSPIAITLTGSDGKFVLPNAPVGTNIPLVIQIGKWRREVNVASVSACTDNPITNLDATRLPAKQSEGDMPRIAVATGGCDVIECVLRKIGIDSTEFTASSGNGTVHLYQGSGGSSVASALAATALWSDPATLSKYDVVLNGCECDYVTAEKPQASLDAMHAYGDKGGRILASHYQYYWIDPLIANASATSPWSNTAAFTQAGFGPDPIAASVDTSYPKGQAFADWLVATGASSTKGAVQIANVRYDATGVNAPSSQWLSAANGDAGALLHYTFETPVAGADGGVAYCGKTAFSDFHSSADVGGGTFPSECVTTGMSAEELALEFLFFDAQACIGDDTKAPKPPPMK